MDNASTDETLERARAGPGELRIVALGENRGFGAACNAGVMEAGHDGVVLLNPDTLLVDGSLADLAALAVELGALCGPELLSEDGSRQPSASARPGGWEVGLDAFVPAALLPAALRVRCEPWRASSETRVGWLTGACLAGPREVLLRLGPFDERIELYGEDLDLGLRAARAGVASVYAPDVARVVHLGERSTGPALGERRVARKLDARRDVVRSHLGRRRERADFAAQIVFHATRFAAKRVLGRPAESEAAWLRAARR